MPVLEIQRKFFENKFYMLNGRTRCIFSMTKFLKLSRNSWQSLACDQTKKASYNSPNDKIFLIYSKFES